MGESNGPDLLSKTNIILEGISEKIPRYGPFSLQKITDDYFQPCVINPQKDTTSEGVSVMGEAAKIYANLNEVDLVEAIGKLKKKTPILTSTISLDAFNESVHIARAIKTYADLVSDTTLIDQLQLTYNQYTLSPDHIRKINSASAAMKKLLYEAYKRGRFGTGEPRVKRQNAKKYYDHIKTRLMGIGKIRLVTSNWDYEITHGIISEFEAMTAVHEECTKLGYPFNIYSATAEQDSEEATDFIAEVICTVDGKKIREIRRYQVKKLRYFAQEIDGQKSYFQGTSNTTDWTPIDPRLIEFGRDVQVGNLPTTRIEILHTPIDSYAPNTLKDVQLSAKRFQYETDSVLFSEDFTYDDFMDQLNKFGFQKQEKKINGVTRDDNNSKKLKTAGKWESTSYEDTQYIVGWIFIFQP